MNYYYEHNLFINFPRILISEIISNWDEIKGINSYQDLYYYLLKMFDINYLKNIIKEKIEIYKDMIIFDKENGLERLDLLDIVFKLENCLNNFQYFIK